MRGELWSWEGTGGSENKYTVLGGDLENSKGNLEKSDKQSQTGHTDGTGIRRMLQHSQSTLIDTTGVGHAGLAWGDSARTKIA